MKKNKKLTPEHRRRIGLGHIGMVHTEETKRKISESRKGKSAGSERYNWKGGDAALRPHCVQCNKQLSNLKAKECQPCYHKRFKGENHASWRGGLTSVNAKIRNSTEMKLWRKSVFNRDDFRCQACGARSGVGKKVVLHADHELPFALYPDLRFEVLNGRTLCAPCHRETPTFGGRTVADTY